MTDNYTQTIIYVVLICRYFISKII